MSPAAPEIFEITAREEDGKLHLAASSPAGQASESFSLRLKAPAAADRPQSRNVVHRPEPAAPAEEEAPEPGHELFAALFGGQLGRLLATSLALAAERRRELRLVWRLEDAPGLAALPIEQLAEGRRSFAVDPRTPVVRALPAPATARPAIATPCRVLVATACPADAGALDLEGELRAIGQAFAPLVRRGLARVDYCRDATLAELGRRLRRRPYDLLHFAGHGASFADGSLMLEADRRGEQVAERERLEVLLGPHLSLHLVVLNCCSSAEADRASPGSGLAQGLSRLDVPAVIGMRSPVADGAAVDFAKAFYGAFAAGRPVDVAVNLGRQAMRLENHPPEDWAAPVLFLRHPYTRAIAVAEPPPLRIGPAALGDWVVGRLLDLPGRSAPALALLLVAATLAVALPATFFGGQLLYQALAPAESLDTRERLVGLVSLGVAPLAFGTWRGGAVRLWRSGHPLAAALAGVAVLLLFFLWLGWALAP